MSTEIKSARMAMTVRQPLDRRRSDCITSRVAFFLSATHPTFQRASPPAGGPGCLKNGSFSPGKKNAYSPSVPDAFCPAKKSHEGGGEHSADDPDKAIAGAKLTFPQNPPAKPANPLFDSPSGK